MDSCIVCKGFHGSVNERFNCFSTEIFRLRAMVNENKAELDSLRAMKERLNKAIREYYSYPHTKGGLFESRNQNSHAQSLIKKE